jgi:hypothetical protein
MPSTGIVPARVATDAAGSNSNQNNVELKPTALALVRAPAHWFFWIAGLVVLDAAFTAMVSHPHPFTRFGIITMIENLARSPESIGRIHLVLNGWLAAGLILVGYCAAEGHKWAFAVGLTAFFIDGALLVAAGDYLGAAFHLPVLYGVYLGLAALRTEAAAKVEN